MPEIIFKRSNICKAFDIGKNVFYMLTRLPGTPIKRIGGRQGVWACNVSDMEEFIRNLKEGEDT